MKIHAVYKVKYVKSNQLLRSQNEKVFLALTLKEHVVNKPQLLKHLTVGDFYSA